MCVCLMVRSLMEGHGRGGMTISHGSGQASPTDKVSDGADTPERGGPGLCGAIYLNQARRAC